MADPFWSNPEFWTPTTTAAMVAGGTVAVMALCIAILRRRGTRMHTQRTDRQAKVVTRFQTASPFQEAVEKLADRSDMEVRVAAVESLKELARQSPQNYWSVMEILTAHLRRYARAPVGASPANANSGSKTALAADIQAVLSVFLHRDTQYESREAVLDLRHTDLSRADLRGIFLRYADLGGAALVGTALRSANLRDANLRAARLDSANLRGADLRGANFSEASLRDADLRYSDMRGVNLNNLADLIHANLGDADLREASMIDAVMCEATLSRASLRGAVLEFADLRGAALDEAYLREANLGGADLRHARLNKADLRSAILSDADLSFANLRGADLREADLKDVEFHGAKLTGVRFSEGQAEAAAQGKKAEAGGQTAE